MIKICLFSLIIISVSYSDTGIYLYTKNTRCIHDLKPNNTNSGFCYRYSNNPTTQRCTRLAKITHFIKGYTYNTSTNECELEHDLQITGLSSESHSNIMINLSVAFSLAFFSILFMLVV